MKKLWRTGLFSFFLLMVIVGGVTLHSLVKIQSFGKLVNYVGIVRGATQRLIKLELAGEPDDEMILYLDEILDELNTGKGKYGLLQLKDPVYQGNLQKLTKLWTELKREIEKNREDPQEGEALLELSEKYFALANSTVFSADEYSASQALFLMKLILLMFTGMLITWGMVFRIYGRRLFHLETSYKTLEAITSKDPLTGVYNLSKFENEAQALLGQKQNVKYCVIYVDFADFKYINDVFGYAFGDDILRAYAKSNEESLEEGEVMGRVSADNFVLLRKYTDKEELLERQQKADSAISDYCSQPLSVNCGFCCMEDVIEDLDISGLLTRANYARKTVKNGQKRNYAFYDEGIRSRLRLEKEIEGRMQSALDEHEFEVYYQPKVDVKTEKPVCAEALVRWRRPGGEVVVPDLFIPVFEKNFQIASLDQYVFDAVCSWLRRRLDEGKNVIPISVNVSRLQFYDVGFIDTYSKLRDKYRIPDGLLEIEFTESIAFENTQLLLKTLKGLKQARFETSIDDFGKGYSSLSLLKQVPVDELKIDRLFFMEGENEKRDCLVVEGIVKIAHSLGIRTVAEGIENRDMRVFLNEIGCDRIQGYAYYRPLPQETFEKLLEYDQNGDIN